MTRVASVFALLCLGACHHAPASTTVGRTEGGLIGDTAAFGPRLLDINRTRNRVTYELAQPAHLVLLSVVPGKTIEPVGGIPVDTGIIAPGKHVVTVATQRETEARPNVWSAADQADYDRCVTQGRRALPKKTVVIQDSTGKTIYKRTGEPDDASREFEVERRCEAAINRRARPATPDLSDRYLVLLASNAPLTLMQVVARLDAMTVYADDVQSTISSIAEALYVDRRAVWSGHYVRW